jgi:cytosine/uracil/thiamine/allantoin permease
MKRLIIGSIIWSALAIVGFLGAISVVQLICYEIFWTILFGIIIISGINDIRENIKGKKAK